MTTPTEVEETIRRIQSHKGVLGLVVVNADGIPIRTTMDNASSVQYASLISFFTAKTRSVLQKLEPTNELKFIRLRSLKHEIMVAPDNEYLLVIVQDPSVRA